MKTPKTPPPSPSKALEPSEKPGGRISAVGLGLFGDWVVAAITGPLTLFGLLGVGQIGPLNFSMKKAMILKFLNY